MGSGFFMMGSAMEGLKALSPKEQKECLEALGLDYLINVYSENAYEDFETKSKKGAELLAKGLEKLLKASHGSIASADVQRVKGKYKISFFK